MFSHKILYLLYFQAKTPIIQVKLILIVQIREKQLIRTT